MRKRSFKVVVAAGVAVVGALVLSSCFGANLKLSGKHDSILSPGIGKKVEIAVKSSSSLGLPWGGMSGSLKDNGLNEAFPYGVKINFNRGVANGLADFCEEPSGPARRVHAVGGVVRGSTGPNPCSTASGVSGATPRAWAGIVTYSSGDRSHYPNTLNPVCSALYFQLYFDAFGVPLAPTRKGAASSTGGEDIVGVGAMVVFDSNGNRNVDRGDRFAFAALCGPYANLAVPGCEDCPITPADYDFYSYGTCTDEGPLPGVIPGFDAEAADPLAGLPPDFAQYVFSELSQENCFHTLTYGDLQVIPIYGLTGPR